MQDAFLHCSGEEEGVLAQVTGLEAAVEQTQYIYVGPHGQESPHITGHDAEHPDVLAHQ